MKVTGISGICSQNCCSMARHASDAAAPKWVDAWWENSCSTVRSTKRVALLESTDADVSRSAT